MRSYSHQAGSQKLLPPHWYCLHHMPACSNVATSKILFRDELHLYAQHCDLMALPHALARTEVVTPVQPPVHFQVGEELGTHAARQDCECTSKSAQLHSSSSSQTASQNRSASDASWRRRSGAEVVWRANVMIGARTPGCSPRPHEPGKQQVSTERQHLLAQRRCAGWEALWCERAGAG